MEKAILRRNKAGRVEQGSSIDGGEVQNEFEGGNWKINEEEGHALEGGNRSGATGRKGRSPYCRSPEKQEKKARPQSTRERNLIAPKPNCKKKRIGCLCAQPRS